MNKKTNGEKRRRNITMLDGGGTQGSSSIQEAEAAEFLEFEASLIY